MMNSNMEKEGEKIMKRERERPAYKFRPSHDRNE